MTSGVATQVQRLTTELSLTQAELAGVVGASPRTISRWAAGEAVPQRMSKQRLLELVAVGELLKTVLKPEDANLWIFTPNRMLGHATPAQRIASGGFRDVIALVEALADGVVF